MQREAETERERAAAMQAQLAEVQAQSDELQSQLEQMQAEAAQMQITLDEKQAVSRAWQTFNLEMQTLALFNARMLTAQDAAERLGVHVTTVRRKARQLNGVSGKNIRPESLEV
jgi:UDP-N-acetylmuramyl tripeptide synthase